ncbi:hypothetical protein CLAIMM_07779 [Cladophialophora immunda]|nr:hypothetical protein CLAIMM_07779 [Cladophialophora immunda]
MSQYAVRRQQLGRRLTVLIYKVVSHLLRQVQEERVIRLSPHAAHSLWKKTLHIQVSFCYFSAPRDIRVILHEIPMLTHRRWAEANYIEPAQWLREFESPIKPVFDVLKQCRRGPPFIVGTRQFFGSCFIFLDGLLGGFKLFRRLVVIRCN